MAVFIRDQRFLNPLRIGKYFLHFPATPQRPQRHLRIRPAVFLRGTSLPVRIHNIATLASNASTAPDTTMNSKVTNTKKLSLPEEIFTDEVAQSIIDFWYDGYDMGEIKPSDTIFMRWFTTNEEFDNRCRDKFGTLLENLTDDTPTKVLKDKITFLATNPIRALALHILLDQIPRNIFRGGHSAVVYTKYDPLALHLALYSIAPNRRFDLGPDGSWNTKMACRLWFYLPMSHAENLKMHELGIKLIVELRTECEKLGLEAVEFVKEYEGFVEEHRDIIRRFGRYPYRNKVLGRESTVEEAKWLVDTGIDWAR